MKRPRKCWQRRGWWFSAEPGICIRCFVITRANAEMIAEALTDAIEQRFFIERVGQGRTH